MRANQETKYNRTKVVRSLICAILAGAAGCQSASNYRTQADSGDAIRYSMSVAQPVLQDKSKLNRQQSPVSQVAFSEPVVRQAPTPKNPMSLDGATDESRDADAASPAAAESSGLSLAHLEGMATQFHPALAEARARINATRGQYVQAGLPFNPSLQYGWDEIGNDGANGLHSVQLSQEFVTANKLGLAQQGQAQEAQKRRAELQTAELRVLTGVRIAFLRTLIAQRRLELAQQIVGISQKSLDSVEAMLEAKEVNKISLLQARVEAEQAQITVENAATQLDANRKSLAAAVGLPLPPESALEGDLDHGLTDKPWDELLSKIIALSPELASATSELERARWALQLACAQVTPNVTGQAGVGVDTGTNDTYATFGVSVPLPILNRNQGNIQTAHADIAAASAAIERTRLSLESRLASAVGRYRTARERYLRLERQVVPDAEETFHLSRTAFEAGETDFLQLLTTQRTLFSLRVNALDALEQAREAQAEIDGMVVTLQ